jgi:hypothetical protein
MDVDVIVKVATFVLGVIGTGKLFYDLAIGKRTRMRDEYKFAKEYLEDQSRDPKMHPFLRELGCRAIAGDERLTAEEVEYLLSLANPDRALKDYVMGRPYLAHLPTGGNLKVNFKEKFHKTFPRKWRQFSFLFLYVLFSALAFGPFLFSRFLFKDIREMLLVSGFAVVVFGPYAWYSLQAAARIRRAERLVENQAHHTQSISLDTR